MIPKQIIESFGTKEPRHKRYTNNGKIVPKSNGVCTRPILTNESSRNQARSLTRICSFTTLFQPLLQALENDADGIRATGIPLNNLRYADYTVLLTEDMPDLQNMLNKIITVSREYGLTRKLRRPNS